MKNIKNIAIVFSSLAFLATSMPFVVQAQESDAELEEVIITGRKREESLTDVPVSISVWNSANLRDAGILTQQDLFDATPGLSFDDSGDRNTSNPAIRGVQSSEVTTTLQKVNSFVDGVPLLGQVGALRFSGIDQVEVYRGPQSAAFGGSTFAGAINYATADATDEFEGTIQLGTSNFGRNEAGIVLSGPISDRLGYRISYIGDEFTGPDEWEATDGTELGSEQTGTFTAKLNFEFSDSVYGEVMYTRLDQDDGPAVNWLLDPNECSGDSGILTETMMGEVAIFSGDFDCDVFATEPRRNHDLLAQFEEAYAIDENRLAFEDAILSAGMNGQVLFDAADLDGNGELSVDEFLGQQTAQGITGRNLILGQSVDPAVVTERDRIQGELNFEVGDSLLTFIGMYSEEFSQSWVDNDIGDTLAVISTNGMGATTLGMNTLSMANPTDLDEEYVEVRWASPANKRLRYTLSASHYDYDVNTSVFSNFGALAFGLTFDDDFDPSTPEIPIDPNRTTLLSNSTVNQGIGFGLNYDLTDRTTFSLEGRYEQIEACGTDLEQTENNTLCRDFNTFAPRIAITTQLSDTSSIYAQISQGTNPGGVNAAFLDQGNLLSLQVASGQIAVPEFDSAGLPIDNAGILYNGENGNPEATVPFSAEDFQTYDEETLTNFEVGFKGTFMEGRGSFATAIYYMELDNLIDADTLNWDDSTVGGWNEFDWAEDTSERVFFNGGDSRFYGVEFDGNLRANDMFSLGLNFSVVENEFIDFCSVEGVTDYVGADFEIRTRENDGVDIDCAVFDGNEVNRQSTFSGAFDVTATLPDMFGMRTSLRADLRHTGGYFQDDANLIKRSAVNQVNLAATLRGDNVNLRFYVTNLTDNEEPRTISGGIFYRDNDNIALAADGSEGAYSITPNRPREFGMSLTYDF